MKIVKTAFPIALKIIRRNTAIVSQSFISLLISALVLTTVLSLISSVRVYLLNQSTELMGGDIVISKATELTINESAALQKLVNQGARIAERNQTTVMLSNSDKTRSILSSVKIVSEDFPLYGEIRTKPELQTMYSKDSLLVEQAFLDRMNGQPGETVYIGESAYTIQAVLLSEPDQFSSSFPLGPKILMSQEAWARSGIQNEMSRMQYSMLIKLPANFANPVLLEQLEKEFELQKARVEFASDGPQRLLRILDITQQFFLIFVLLSFFLVIVNIYTNFTFLFHRFLKTIAVLRVLGMPKHGVATIFVLILMILSVIAAFLGTIIGNFLVQRALLYAPTIISGFTTAPPFILDHISTIIVFTIFVSFISALPILLRIIDIEPNILLTQVLSSSHNSLVKSFLLIIIGMMMLMVGMWWFTKNLFVAFVTVGVVSAIFITFVVVIHLLTSFLYKKRYSFPFVLRSIISFIKNQGLIGITSIASLTLALSIIFTLSLVEKNITTFLQSQVQENAPNLYILDIQQDQIEGIKEIIPSSLQLFSVTRARFIRTDDRFYSQNNPADREFLREFNLTNRTTLIEGEKLVEGVWHGETGKKVVSVEKEFAEDAGIQLGSEVELSVQGVPVIATVTSIREVETTQGLPFFFFVFSPDLLEKAPKTYFGYVNVSQNEIPALQNQISLQFPTITTIPTADVIATVEQVISTLTLVVIITSFPTLILGMMLVFGMMINNAQERVRNLLLFSIFGASRKQLFFQYVIEALVSILFASVFALIFSLCATYALNRFVFEFNELHFSYNLFILIFFIVSFTILFALYLMHILLAKTPHELLRES